MCDRSNLSGVIPIFLYLDRQPGFRGSITDNYVLCWSLSHLSHTCLYMLCLHGDGAGAHAHHTRAGGGRLLLDLGRFLRVRGCDGWAAALRPDHLSHHAAAVLAAHCAHLGRTRHQLPRVSPSLSALLLLSLLAAAASDRLSAERPNPPSHPRRARAHALPLPLYFWIAALPPPASLLPPALSAPVLTAVGV